MNKTAVRNSACSATKNEMSAQRMNANCATMSNATCEVPRCEIRIEEHREGCKIYCTCEDEIACATLQNLCSAMESGSGSIICTRDGEMCCECCFDCCDCTCQMLMNGVCISCSTVDKNCLKMVQAMCKCLCCCGECGCERTVCINDTPVCHCG